MKLLDNPKKSVIGVAILVTALLLAFATKCHSADGDTQFSGGAAIMRGPTAALQLEYLWGEHGDHHLESGITLVGTSDHYEGFPQYQGHQQNNFFLNTTLIDGFGPVDLGLGLAFIQNTDAYNSTGANFHLLAGYHFKHLHLSYNHFSNAGTKHPNMGRDIVLLGWRF